MWQNCGPGKKLVGDIFSGRYVLFQNKDLPSMVARIAGIISPIPEYMVACGRNSSELFTADGQLCSHLKDSKDNNQRSEMSGH